MKFKSDIVGLFALGLFSTTAFSDILFQENFDGQADWTPADSISTCTPVCADGPPPTGWSYYFVEEQFVGGGFRPALAINNEQPRGGAGKSAIFYEENRLGGQWVSDSDLVKRLDKEYPELYVRFYLKFQPGFQFAPTGSATFKLFRIYRYMDEGNPFQFFRNEITPMFINNISNNAFGNRQVYSIRCNGNADGSDYFCPGTPGVSSNVIETNHVQVEADTGIPFTNFYASIGDGNWHKFEFVIKLNSAPGVTDGIFRRWVDGHLMYEKTNIDFVKLSGAGNNVKGFNMVGIGGNDYNQFDGTNQSEQWYAIDDLLISSQAPPSQSNSALIQ